MRVGLTTSIAGHVLLLAWGLISLPSAEPLDAMVSVDAMPVDLVPLSDVTRLSEGKKTAPKAGTPSAGKAKPPVPRPESAKVGNAKTDQDAPITEKTTETAAAPTKESSAPPPPPPPKAPPKPAPEKPPEPKAPEPEPEPEPAPKPPEPKAEAPKAPTPPAAETGELAAEEKPEETPPKPVPAVAPKAKPRPPKPEPVQTASADDTPKPPSKETSPKKAEKTSDKKAKPKDDKTETFNPDDIDALLNKVDPSGGGSRASTQEASLGSEKASGTVAEMTQSELDGFRSAVAACWNYPAGADGAESLRVRLRIEFTPGGEVTGTPSILQQPAGPLGTVAAEGAIRAVLRCAPYTMLSPEKYETWKVVNFTFDPAEMF